MQRLNGCGRCLENRTSLSPSIQAQMSSGDFAHTSLCLVNKQHTNEKCSSGRNLLKDIKALTMGLIFNMISCCFKSLFIFAVKIIKLAQIYLESTVFNWICLSPMIKCGWDQAQTKKSRHKFLPVHFLSNARVLHKSTSFEGEDTCDSVIAFSHPKPIFTLISSSFLTQTLLKKQFTAYLPLNRG